MIATFTLPKIYPEIENSFRNGRKTHIFSNSVARRGGSAITLYLSIDVSTFERIVKKNLAHVIYENENYDKIVDITIIPLHIAIFPLFSL